MAKNIIVCTDGTWNGPAQDDNADGIPDVTNVLKLFGNLAGTMSAGTAALQNEQEKTLAGADGAPLQVAKYLHGVGDSRNRIQRLLGGVFGAGVIQRIIRGYSFVCRSYEPGDAIHLVGFSRGAYTARALGGLICGVGLLDAGKLDLADDDTRYKAGIGAWLKYRRKTVDIGLLATALEAAGYRVSDSQLIADVPIRSIGVWDTVGSYGVPAYALAGARLDLFRFADCKLSTKVANGFHAVSIDEQRSDFTPTLWEDAPNVTQVWFAGAHADVGGGYAQAGLSDIALEWMIQRLGECGAQFTTPAAYAYQQDCTIAPHKPWEEAPWDLLAKANRTVPPGAWIHGSVVSRGDPFGAALQPFVKSGQLDSSRFRLVDWSPPQPRV